MKHYTFPNVANLLDEAQRISDFLTANPHANVVLQYPMQDENGKITFFDVEISN